MNEVKLLPCPLCGREVEVHWIEPHRHIFATSMADCPGEAMIECSCGLGMIRDTEAEVIDAWNMRESVWIPLEERLPNTDDYILLSFSNFSMPCVGRYEKWDDGSGSFYVGDCDEEDTCISQDLFVNAWMPLPRPYRRKKELGAETSGDKSKRD